MTHNYDIVIYDAKTEKLASYNRESDDASRISSNYNQKPGIFRYYDNDRRFQKKNRYLYLPEYVIVY